MYSKKWHKRPVWSGRLEAVRAAAAAGVYGFKSSPPGPGSVIICADEEVGLKDDEEESAVVLQDASENETVAFATAL